MCRGRFCGAPRRAAPQAAGGRSPPEPAQRAPCGAWVRGLYGGAGWCGEGARRAPRPKAGDGGGRRPPPRRRRRRPAGRLVRGICLGEGGAGAGGGSGPRRGPPAWRAEVGQSPAAGAAGAGLRGLPGLGRKENGYSWSCSPTSRSRTMPPVAGRFLVRRRWSLGTMPGT